MKTDGLKPKRVFRFRYKLTTTLQITQKNRDPLDETLRIDKKMKNVSEVEGKPFSRKIRAAAIQFSGEVSNFLWDK